MTLFQLLTSLNYTVTEKGVNFDDEAKGFYIDVNFDPENSSNNRCEIKTDTATIKLSEAKECKLYDFLHSLWKEEIEAIENDKELKEDQLENIMNYGV